MRQSTIKSKLAQSAKTGLTVAYLFSALAITVATSKMPDKADTPGVMGIGITNYAASSTCFNAIGDIAIRSNSGTIEKSMYPNGRVTPRPIHFKILGFPNRTAVIGLDQVGSGDEPSCKIVDRKSVLNTGYDENQKSQGFYQLGKLTTFVYACTLSQGSTCRITLRELPFGPLEDVYF